MASRPRFLAPEVVQSSALDCGPAALQCLLEGFGLRVNYGRLREACQTGIDGTSIDAIESVANQLGLEAEQIMLPADHLLLSESKALPAIVVVKLPSGLTHFVVLWRRCGPLLQALGACFRVSARRLFTHDPGSCRRLAGFCFIRHLSDVFACTHAGAQYQRTRDYKDNGARACRCSMARPGHSGCRGAACRVSIGLGMFGQRKGVSTFYPAGV